MKNYIVLSFFILSCFLIGCSAETKQEDNKLITNKEYHQIERGMTYEEVRDLVGGVGKKDGDDSSNTIHYIWDGKKPNSFASITFRNNKVISKMEQGVASR